MRWLRLIEFHESDWCPKVIRDAATDNLQFAQDFANPYAPIVPQLTHALERTGTRRIVDLCSGAGGPWLRMHRMLEKACNTRIEVCLTDKHPNVRAFRRVRTLSQNRVSFCSDSVDATQLPYKLNGFMTIFTSFHHFAPEKARSILRNAVNSREGIGVFEVTARQPHVILLMCLALPIVLLSTPFIRPFRWSRLVWTYVIPIVPVIVTLDGIVSCLRTYSPSELREMTEGLRERGYVWHVGKVRPRFSPLPITYLIGHPEDGKNDTTCNT
jgi:hypothetical protein